MAGTCDGHGRSSWRSPRRARRIVTAVPSRVRRREVSLERAVSVIATAAAYDLRHATTDVVLPMFWHYRAVELHTDGQGERTFRWPDGTEGHRCAAARALPPLRIPPKRTHAPRPGL